MNGCEIIGVAILTERAPSLFICPLVSIDYGISNELKSSNELFPAIGKFGTLPKAIRTLPITRIAASSDLQVNTNSHAKIGEGSATCSLVFQYGSVSSNSILIGQWILYMIHQVSKEVSKGTHILPH